MVHLDVGPDGSVSIDACVSTGVAAKMLGAMNPLSGVTNLCICVIGEMTAFDLCIPAAA